ncbi:MAG: lysis system i-spanin subunit Rz [Pseudomonadota bacterium]
MKQLIAGLAGGKGYAAAAVLAAAVAGSAGFGAAWKWQALSYGAAMATLERDHKEEQRAISEAHAGIVNANLDWMKRIAARLGALEAAAWQELEDARIENERFRTDLLDGAERMWVRIDPHSISRGGAPGGAAGAGLDDEAAYARLHPAVAADLARLAADADEAARQLNHCQDRELERRKKE